MTAAPMASWSLVASPEYDPGREVLIDCEEYGLPHPIRCDASYFLKLCVVHGLDFGTKYDVVELHVRIILGGRGN